MSCQGEAKARKHPHSWHHLDGIGLKSSGDQNTLSLLQALLEDKRKNAIGSQQDWLILHCSTPLHLHPELTAFQFFHPFWVLHMLKQLEKELSSHVFSGYGQNFLALEHPYKIILTIF